MTGTCRSAAQPDPSGPHSTTWQYECVSKEIRILAMSDGKVLVGRSVCRKKWDSKQLMLPVGFRVSYGGLEKRSSFLPEEGRSFVWPAV